MPEGPSIIILKEELQPFVGKKITAAGGNSKQVDFKAITGSRVIDFKSWGKHFLIVLPDRTLRIHLLMFGKYSINDDTSATEPRLRLEFGKKFLNFYSCAVTTILEPLDEVYDWSADVMSPAWSARRALAKLRANPHMLVCDALLDQQIFSGVGNIIKNEVLFRIRVNPKSTNGSLPATKLRAMVKEAAHYSFQFLEWKKAFTLKKHWLAHTKKICPRDGHPIIKEYLGKTNRRTFFCTACQVLYV
jgi:endonuclease-8